MPRKAKPRTDRRDDLKGTWYQCMGAGQHLTESPYFIGEFPYCDRDDCSARVRLVHSSHEDKENVEERRRIWNSMDSPSIGKLVKEIKDTPSVGELESVVKEVLLEGPTDEG